jgi:RNA polymerase sigma-70 factor (ECF subfamily)
MAGATTLSSILLSTTRQPDMARVDDARVRRIVREYHDFVWRSLRRMGVPDGATEDATQQVFLVITHKLDAVTRESERSFLFGTVVRVAADARRTQTRRREVHGEALEERVDESPNAEAILDEKRARAILDDILESMSEELRAVFVLFEIEELTAAEVAELLAIPVGTVSSRLRRAREHFHAAANRMKRSLEARKT